MPGKEFREKSENADGKLPIDAACALAAHALQPWPFSLYQSQGAATLCSRVLAAHVWAVVRCLPIPCCGFAFCYNWYCYTLAALGAALPASRTWWPVSDSLHIFLY